MDNYSTCTVGIDLGDRSSMAYVHHGERPYYFEFPMTASGVELAFPPGKFGQVVMEAGTQSAWVSRQLGAIGYRTVVANPRKVKAIYANERKSDRNDARILAELGAFNTKLLYPIPHRSEEQDIALRLLGARQVAVRARVSIINALRAMAKSVGLRFKSSSAEGFAVLEASAPEPLRLAMAGLFSTCRALDVEIAKYDGHVERLCKEAFPETGRMSQVCGVGPVTSLTLTLLWSSPKRFKNGRAAAAYVGLAPRRDQSGSSDKQLPISKTGNGTARRLLVQCALVLLGRRGVDCDLQRWARKKLEQGGKNAKKRIVVALARKLAVLLFRLWKTGDAWEPPRNANLILSASQGAVSCAERPKSAVSSDSAGNAENVVPHGTRAADWSTPDGSDPTMHRAEPIAPTTSADRSLGHGTTANKLN